MTLALGAHLGCSSSGKGSDDDSSAASGGAGAGGAGGSSAMSSGGQPTGGSSGMTGGSSGTTGGSAGAVAKGGAAGRASAAGGSGATSTGPTACTGLTRDATVSPFYTPPDPMLDWDIAGTFDNGQGVLLALIVDRSVRLIAIAADGTETELLNETEYTRGWPFDPTEVVAYRSGDDVDVLVTDNANAALVSKHGGKATSVGLAETDYMDLHVLGFVPTASSLLAVYFRGDTQNVTPGTLSVYDPTTQMTATRSLPNDASPVITTHPTGAWLTTERLDLASDCQDSGTTSDCGGGEQPVPVYTCTWHLDIWSATDASFTTAAPLTTVDVPASISPYCDDDAPAGLGTYSSTIGDGIGFGRHHATAVDMKTGSLAVAMQNPLGPGMPGVKLELVDRSGTALIDGTTAPLNAINESSWMAVLAGNAFICGGDYCAMSDAKTATGFKFPYMDSALTFPDAALHRPNGLALLGGINGNPIWSEPVSCNP